MVSTVSAPMQPHHGLASLFLVSPPPSPAANGITIPSLPTKLHGVSSHSPLGHLTQCPHTLATSEVVLPCSEPSWGSQFFKGPDSLAGPRPPPPICSSFVSYIPLAKEKTLPV